MKIPISFDHEGVHYEGFLFATDTVHQPPELYGVVMNGTFYAYLYSTDGKWRFWHQNIPGDISEILGAYVEAWWE